MVLGVLQISPNPMILSSPKDRRLWNGKWLLQITLADLLLSFLKHLKDKIFHHSPFAYRIEAKFFTGRQGAMLSFQHYLLLGSSLTPLFQTGMSVPSPPTHRLTPDVQPSVRCSHDLEYLVFSFVPTQILCDTGHSPVFPLIQGPPAWNAPGPTSLPSSWTPAYTRCWALSTHSCTPAH